MMLERRKLTKATYQALKRYILLEREKKKQEQEQDKAQERLRRERELRKRKEEEDSLTLEQTKEQLQQLEEKLAELKQEKHGLFSELKKVLHQENEMRQRAQMKEQNEMAALQQQQYASGLPPMPGHTSVFMQSHLGPRPKYMNVNVQQPPGSQGIKRSRSPSPPPQGHYASQFASQYGPGGSYSGGPSGSVKQEPYCAAKPGVHGGPYGNQQPPPRHASYQSAPGQQQSAGPGKYPAGSGTPQSAFSLCQQSVSLYGQQQQQQQQSAKAAAMASEQYSGYQRQPPRHPSSQSGYASPHHSSGPGSVPALQQQLEHASQKAGFADDKMKSHQQQQQAIMSTGMVQQSMNAAGQNASRGSILSMYQQRPSGAQNLPTTAYSTSGSTSNMMAQRHGQSRY